MYLFHVCFPVDLCVWYIVDDGSTQTQLQHSQHTRNTTVSKHEREKREKKERRKRHADVYDDVEICR